MYIPTTTEEKDDWAMAQDIARSVGKTEAQIEILTTFHYAAFRIFNAYGIARLKQACDAVLFASAGTTVIMNGISRLKKERTE